MPINQPRVPVIQPGWKRPRPRRASPRIRLLHAANSRADFAQASGSWMNRRLTRVWSTVTVLGLNRQPLIGLKITEFAGSGSKAACWGLFHPQMARSLLTGGGTTGFDTMLRRAERPCPWPQVRCKPQKACWSAWLLDCFSARSTMANVARDSLVRFGGCSPSLLSCHSLIVSNSRQICGRRPACPW